MASMTVLDVVQNRTISVPISMRLLPTLVWVAGVFLGMQALGRAQTTGAGVVLSTAAVVLLLGPFGPAVVGTVAITGAVLLLG
jgi:hypothetical protein